IQRLRQLLALLTEVSLGELRHGVRIRAAMNQQIEDGACGLAHHVGCDRGQLDIGSFQRLLQPVDQVDTLSNEVEPVPCQLAQLSLRRRRYKACLHKTDAKDAE